TVAKLVPILGVIALGGALLYSRGAVPVDPAFHASLGGWMQSLLILIFVYGGFETAFAPMSEARNPQRDAAFAVFAALITCAFVYTAIQWIVVGLLPNAAASERPLADVARLALGPRGAGIVSVGALLSLYGYLSAKILSVPRVPFALAEQGDLPSFVGRVHPRFHTPH